MVKATKRRLIPILLAVVMVCLAGLTMLLALPSPALADDSVVSEWDGDLIAAGWGDEEDKTLPVDDDGNPEYVVTYVDGDDGPIDTVTIKSAAALAYFAHEVYLDGQTAWDSDAGKRDKEKSMLDGAEVKLTVNIDLACNKGNIWIPIGQTNYDGESTADKVKYRFVGTFDGGEHTIYNLDTAEFTKNIKHDDEYYVEYTYSGPKEYNSSTAKVPLPLNGDEFNYGLFALVGDFEVKDLSIVGVNFDFYETIDGAKADRCGAIVAFGCGKATFTDCTVGSTNTEDKFYTKKTTSGGLAGCIYAFGSTAETKANYQNVTFTNCVNYVDLTENIGESTSGGKKGGILGYTGTYNKDFTVDSCINYGNISGGLYIGGMTSYHYPTNGKGNTHKIVNCANYGNISSKYALEAGGMSNLSANYGNATIIVSNCNNYGNIGGKIAVGGILGIFDQEGADAKSDLTNNYNYGNIYCYGDGNGTAGNNQKATSAGGLFGYMYFNGTTTYSGGTLGTVHGGKNVAETLGRNSIGSVIGALVPHTGTPSLTPIFVADAGSVKQYDNNTLVPDATEDDTVAGGSRYEVKLTAGDFIYGDEQGTILLGLADNSKQIETLRIPNTVRIIAATAFAGHSELKTLDLNNVEQIEDFAFAGTSLTTLTLDGVKTIGSAAFAGIASLTNVTLPAGLTELGAAAFAGCQNLGYVTLPSDASNLVVGERAFSGTKSAEEGGTGAYVIAASQASYKQLAALGTLANTQGVLTYKVTINYVYDGESLGSEVKLFGRPYTVTLEDGIWTNIPALENVGPQASDGSYYVWYTSTTDRTTPYAQPSDMTALLARISSDTLTMYSFGSGDMVFIALDGLTFNYHRYTVNEINTLMHPSSTYINLNTMDVEIRYNGATATQNYILNAGTYQVTVKDKSSGKELGTFTIYIDYLTVDLALRNNLQWFITELGGEPVPGNNNRIELTSRTLYVYTYKMDISSGGVIIHKQGDEYPSPSRLDASEIERLKLNTEYDTRIVSYSAARNRGTEITLSVEGNTFSVNEASYVNNKAKDAGTYEASVEITANTNYKFVVGNVGEARGMTIELGDTAQTAKITKTWYIVNFSNYFVFENSPLEYSISDHVFGNNGQVLTVAQPRAYYSTGSVLRMSLYLTVNGNETLIYDNDTFTTEIWNAYFHQYMPAGTYRLELSSSAATSQDTDGTIITHDAFNETFTFVVDKAPLPSFESLKAAFEDHAFIFDVDVDTNKLHDIDSLVNAYLNSSAFAQSSGVYDSAYYGGAAIRFNLLRDHTDLYTDTVTTNLPDTYTVYYEISANNYYSNIESDSRYNYSFSLIKYKTLPIPAVQDLTYTGNNVLPTIDTTGGAVIAGYTSLYEVVWETGNAYVNAGTHSVSFVLNDSVHYRWVGLGDASTAQVSFEVTPASNEFTVALSMLGWRFGEFEAATNTVRVAVKFGAITDIHFSILQNGTAVKDLGDFTIGNDGQVTAAIETLLKGLPTGTYTLRAVVNASKNYDRYEREIEFAVDQVMNTWLDGDDDLKLPSWIIGNFNPADMIVKAQHGKVNIRIIDVEKDADGKEVVYYNSTTDGEDYSALNKMNVGTYLLIAWVDGDVNYSSLVDRTFTIHVFEKPGLPWWVTLISVIGALGIAALIIFILWKKGVFRVITDKILIAIRTRVSVEATIASVRAAKMMEEGKKSVEAAKRKERLEQMRQKAKEKRAMSPEELAAELEAKAQAAEAKAKDEAERAEKARARSDAAKARVEKQNANAEEKPAEPEQAPAETPAEEPASEPVEEQPATSAEESATEQPAASEPAEEASEPAEEPATEPTSEEKPE